ncbi:MAG: helix-hairpin-helix domain-containing protein [Clostridiales bacterium]|nr:helix-hairpin-helix domain-containing protein [Clostridiales bacterium]
MEYKFVQAVIQAQGGSGAAFSKLYSRTYKGIRIFAESLLKNEADVDRVVKDTFTEAFNGISKLSSPENFEEILYSTVAVKCLDVLGGSEKTKAEIEGYASGYEPFGEGVEIFPGSCVSSDAFCSKTEKFIENCSPVVKAIALLYYYASMPFAHISVLLECDEDTVASAVSHFNKDLTKAVKTAIPKSDDSHSSDSLSVLTVVLHKITADREVDVSRYNSLYKEIMPNVEYSEPSVEENTTLDSESIEILSERYDEQVEQEHKNSRIKDNLFSAMIAVGIIVAIIVVGLVIKTFFNKDDPGKVPNNPSSSNSGYFWSTVALSDISDIEPVNGDVAVFTDASTGLKGLINGKGKKLLSAQYAKIIKVDVSFKDTIIGVYEKSDDKEMYVVDSSYTFVSNTPSQIPYSNHYVWDNDRKVLMEVTDSGESAQAIPSSNSNVNELYAVKDKNGLYGMVNGKYNLIIPTKYQSLGEYNEGLVAAKLNGKWGYIDLNAEVVIPFVYDAPVIWEDASSAKHEKTLKFKKGMTAVRKDGKVGIIDSGNNVIVDFTYDDIVLNEGNCFIALRDNKWGLLNINESFIPTTVNRGVTTKASADDVTTLPMLRSYTVTTSGDPLRIRLSPLEGSALVGTIPNGTMINGSVEKNGWVYLTYNGKSGWASSTYLVENVTYTVPTNTTATTPPSNVTTSPQKPGTTTTTNKPTEPKTTVYWRDKYTTAPPTTSENGKININTADISELMDLYGIGRDLAQAIVNYRETNGPFKNISDIKNVDGITEDIYVGIRNNITV